MRLRTSLVLGCALCLAAAACSAILDLQPPPPGESAGDGGSRDSTVPGNDSPAGDTSTTEDSSTTDGPAADGHEAGSCAPITAPLPDGATDADTVFSTMNQVIVDDAGDFSWQFFDAQQLSTKAASYQGGVFDGRYVYFVPSTSGIVTRYDTTAPFQKSSFAIFDTTTLGAQAGYFGGAVFDGKYIYFVPHFGASLSYPGLVVRFDTTGTFGPGPAWSVFDTATLPVPDGGAVARGFHGGVFDGRYVYLVPDTNGTTPVGRVARYDTRGTDGGTMPAGDAGPPLFASAAQWSTFDTSGDDPSALGYNGGVFDGRYVYLVPHYNGGSSNNGASGIVTRYDTTASFNANASWDSYDLTQVNAQAMSFLGGAFDGRYVYMVPFNKSVTLRFDTQRNFRVIPAWEPTTDLSTIVQLPEAGTAQFAGAAFDGRFVYYVPSNSGQVVRFDTVPGGCWHVFDISTLNAAATGFFGAIYDGRYLYLAPRGTVIARFDTKSSTWMPNLPAFHGSFF